MTITLHDLAAGPEYEWITLFRIAGGRSEYDVAEYPTRRANKVRVQRLLDARVIVRYIDPDAPIEIVRIAEERDSWLPWYELWQQAAASPRVGE